MGDDKGVKPELAARKVFAKVKRTGLPPLVGANKIQVADVENRN